MSTIKSFTDIQQSRKLAEILPLENADMCYPYDRHLNKMYGDIPYVMGYKRFNEDTDVPCWSLAALLEEIPSTIINNVGEDLKLHIEKEGLQYYLFYENEYTGDMFEIETESHENMIDACVEMIIRLHESDLL